MSNTSTDRSSSSKSNGKKWKGERRFYEIHLPQEEKRHLEEHGSRERARMPALTQLFCERDRVVDVLFSEKELHAKVVRGGVSRGRNTSNGHHARQLQNPKHTPCHSS